MKLASALFAVVAAFCAAGAAAAELPLHHAKPAAVAKTCKINGGAGVILPGSDTCLRLSGYVSARATFGRTAKSRVIGAP